VLNHHWIGTGCLNEDIGECQDTSRVGNAALRVDFKPEFSGLIERGPDIEFAIHALARQ